MDIKVEAIISSCIAYNEKDEQIAIKGQDQTVESFVKYLRSIHPQSKVDIVTKIELPMVDGEVTNDQTGEITKVKRDFFQKRLDNYTRSLSHRQLTLSEYEDFRKFSAGLLATNVTVSTIVALTVGKTLLTGMAIGVSTALLLDITSLKARKTLLSRRLVALKQK